MTVTRWRVSFELVNPISHPQFYRGERVTPGVTAATVPDECWTPVSRETDSEDDARNQYQGLIQLIAEGDLVRNVRLETSTVAWETVAEGGR